MSGSSRGLLAAGALAAGVAAVGLTANAPKVQANGWEHG
jgi:hypothetical protein